MNDDARALAPVESTDLTVADAADALSRDFQNESGLVESNPPAVEEKKEAEPPVLTNDTKVALKSGEEVSLAELKRGYMSRKHFTLKTQALSEERARLEALRATTQTMHNSTIALRDALDSVAAALLPARPDPQLIDVEPQLYKAQQQHFDYVMGIINDAQQAAQNEFNAAQAARHAEQRDLAQRQMMAKQQQTEKLLEQMPELADANQSRRFQEDAIDTMADYGFSVEELDAVLNDWRSFRMVKDLIALRKARNAAPKVKGKAANVPVLTGKKRMDRAERSNRASRTELEQFRNSGRLDDAAAILAKRMQD